MRGTHIERKQEKKEEDREVGQSCLLDPDRGRQGDGEGGSVTQGGREGGREGREEHIQKESRRKKEEDREVGQSCLLDPERGRQGEEREGQ